MALDFFHTAGRVEVGVDECGRGCLAGPVVAAAVIWPTERTGHLDDAINDSKKVSAKRRKALATYIKEKAVGWAIAFVDNHVIDECNILQATYRAMHQSLDKVCEEFGDGSYGHILVDGNRFLRYRDVPHTCVVGGDAKYISIAAASIIAKDARDDFMKEKALLPEYAPYGWEKNAGYGTKAHVEAIARYGLSDLHRRSFQVRGWGSE